MNSRRRAPRGLSPLARGTPSHFTDVIPRRRFIPAGAGNSILLLFDWVLIMVYPRWRGELCENGTEQKNAVGLSPLTWGTL